MATSQDSLQVNPRGIPHAPFISNVQEHLGSANEDVEPTLQKFQETMSKYKYMEMNTAQRRSGLEEKIPDIRNTLQMVQFLSEKKGSETVQTTFELNDTLYAKAELAAIDQVHLWLGANVMLSYPLEEAITLLTAKLEGAEKSLAAAKEDLDFLREQITIMEVNTARVHNWDVKRRRERREAEAQQAKTSDVWIPERPREERPAVQSKPSFVAPAPAPAPAPVPVPAAVAGDALVVPPLNFDMVCKGVYRSGHPNERNFGFLRQLKLQSIMYLANEDYRANMRGFATAERINVFHFRLSLNKEPTAEMDQKDVAEALKALLDPANHPILVHCNKGKYRVGCLVGLLRRIQNWSHTSIFEEYARFAGQKIADHEFIEVFNLDSIPHQRLDWL